MSMISEQVERLRSLARVNTDDTFRLLWGAANTIEMLSEKVRSNNLHGEWIPVSEALPSEGQVVLAIGDKGTWDVGKFQGTAGWTDDERMWLWKKNAVKRVDYWMPKDAIPLPRKGV